MAHEIYFEDIAIGTQMPTLVKGPLMKLQHVIYAGASGDFNPLHTDDDFARAVGMKDGVITHGMLIMGFVGQAITGWIPKKISQTIRGEVCRHDQAGQHHHHYRQGY